MKIRRVFVGVVEPVNENPVFVDAMHLFRSDLVLDRRAVRPDDCGVKALVAVRFWYGNEVLKAGVYGLIELMESAEREVAVILCADNDAEAVNIERIRERLMLDRKSVV